MGKLPFVTTFLRASWNGNQTIAVRQKVVSGPQAMLDREPTCRLMFEQVAYLHAIMLDAVKQIDATNARVAKINAENAS